MANNRMHFVCNLCIPEGKDYTYDQWTKASFHIAKWYPLSPWYTNWRSDRPYNESLDKFFKDHMHPELSEVGLESPVRLEYEWMGTPVTE